MNSFAKGLICAMAFTTPQGRAVTEKTARIGLKIGDRVLKNKLGIDVREILAEDEKESWAANKYDSDSSDVCESDR